MKGRDLKEIAKNLNPDADVVFSSKRDKTYDFKLILEVNQENRLKSDLIKLKKCKYVCIELKEKVEAQTGTSQEELKFERCTTCGGYLK